MDSKLEVIKELYRAEAGVGFVNVDRLEVYEIILAILQDEGVPSVITTSEEYDVLSKRKLINL